MRKVLEAFYRWFKRFLHKRAIEHGKSVSLWRKFLRSGANDWEDWAEYLQKHGNFRAVGRDCFISPDSVFTDPVLTAIGNNVWIVGAWISGHDGSINMLNHAYGVKLDTVGPVVIKDDVFIGRGATILPGVTIGPRAIVGAGAVVSKDVPPNSVVAGNPAVVIRTLDEHVKKIQERTKGYPWRDLIEKREGGYDPDMEGELVRQRVEYFFNKDHADPGQG